MKPRKTRDFRPQAGRYTCEIMGQDQTDEFAILRADTAKDVGVFPHPMRRHFRAATRGRPAACRITHPSEAGFIFKHQTQRPMRVSSRNGVHFGLKFF